MVSLQEVRSSNARIASALPTGLVAVFVGATSGIGETSLKQFAKHTRQPRIYFVGRSQQAGDRVTAECRKLNPEGQYTFIKADTSLLRNVDHVCAEIKGKEEAINLLFLSTGTMLSHTETSEGLHFAASLVYYSRTRFIVNLLPLLKNAPALRRVVTVFAGGKEGPVFPDDFQAWKVPMLSQRGHFSSVITLSLEALAKKAPDVSFIHEFPGSVKTNLARGGEGAAILVLKWVFKIIGPFINIPNQESGERHVFMATSARFVGNDRAASGVPLEGGLAVASGISGSSAYSIDWNGQASGPKVEALLGKLRADGTVEKVWRHTEGEFKRITGVESV